MAPLFNYLLLIRNRWLCIESDSTSSIDSVSLSYFVLRQWGKEKVKSVKEAEAEMRECKTFNCS